ncbi:hypothetical protein PAXRUDRAFT_16777 [Paxillus rubicundulus Ve08.2h10]|uniref:Unplaced genomic scaffold scaffold_1710, whole genome shotgun sequence n=1 Tax=Paxillus rubicundulus Ve08.2h10 TaxID=930991 RepID=A0A0D0C657_9AGAM|nr:hypothetical protein PAXRUDRAFT_16777 [Paxillus rubicundulus Ve08.2h10]
MDSGILELECWVHGDDVQRTFFVEISSTNTVAALKKAIKNEKPVKFRDVDADALDLYPFPLPDDDKHLEDALNQWQSNDNHQRLISRRKLSLCFPKSDEGKWLIIVKAPSSASRIISVTNVVPDIILNCWVRGHKIGRVFPVKISSTETVAALKKAIKNKKPVDFRDVDADALALRKVSVLVDSDLKETSQALSLHEDVLGPLQTLSDIFTELPLQGHLHIVVEPLLPNRPRQPPLQYPMHPSQPVEAERDIFLHKKGSKAPSEFGRHLAFSKEQKRSDLAIHCNRPPSAAEVVPATLLHPVFGQFLDDCETHEITKEDSSLTRELSAAMSTFYSDEASRAQAVRDVFAKGGIRFSSTEIEGTEYITDGDISLDGYRFFIAEFKNEVGCTGAEPYAQASLHYLEATRRYAATMGHSALPCFIVLAFGPYLAFAGASWNLRPVVQVLSTTLPMHYHSSDTKMRTTVARHLGSLKKAIGTLEEHYRDLSHRARPDSMPYSQLFPYPTSFTCRQHGTQQNFKYSHQLFSEKLLFFGSLASTDAICIKFVRRYSQQVHLRCASMGCAPALLGFESIPGGWFMVVMDALPSDYVCLDNFQASDGCLGRIKDQLIQLHGDGFVHGDIRSTNIVVSKDETKFMILDFDWAGKFGETRYPMNVNTTEIHRPEGVIDGALIHAGHDIAMLDFIAGWSQNVPGTR